MSPISNTLTPTISTFDTVPKSSSQWKLALLEIKRLYIQRQYKQCAARSTELLKTGTAEIHPVHETYLYYYSAISYEVLGRAAHIYSRNKLHLLHSALDAFVTCAAVLPTPREINACNGGDRIPSLTSEVSTQSECSSLLSSITRIIDQSIEFPDEDDPFICSDGEWDSRSAGVLVRFPAEPVEEDGETPRLMPSPLRVRKSSAEIASVGEVLREQGQKVVARSHNQGKAGLPPPLPIKIVPAGEVRAGCSTPTGDDDLVVSKERKQEKIGQVEPSSSPLRESVMRYNGSIRFLRSQIGSSIADLQYLIDEVTEVQHMRRVSKTIRRSVSFWSFSPVKNQSCQKSPDRAFGVVGVGSGSGRVGEKETKEQRIARLRSEGWNTVGLKSGKRGWKGEEYYKAYCAGVLEEMYCI